MCTSYKSRTCCIVSLSYFSSVVSLLHHSLVNMSQLGYRGARRQYSILLRWQRSCVISSEAIKWSRGSQGILLGHAKIIPRMFPGASQGGRNEETQRKCQGQKRKALRDFLKCLRDENGTFLYSYNKYFVILMRCQFVIHFIVQILR